jgi:hypothetical protein
VRLRAPGELEPAADLQKSAAESSRSVDKSPRRAVLNIGRRTSRHPGFQHGDNTHERIFFDSPISPAEHAAAKIGQLRPGGD